MALLAGAGKLPVLVFPGFIANRLQHALWREALALVQGDICDAETVDLCIRNSFEVRLPVMGPLEDGRGRRARHDPRHPRQILPHPPGAAADPGREGERRRPRHETEQQITFMDARKSGGYKPASSDRSSHRHPQTPGSRSRSNIQGPVRQRARAGGEPHGQGDHHRPPDGPDRPADRQPSPPLQPRRRSPSARRPPTRPAPRSCTSFCATTTHPPIASRGRATHRRGRTPGHLRDDPAPHRRPGHPHYEERMALVEARPLMATLNPCTMTFAAGEFAQPADKMPLLAARREGARRQARGRDLREAPAACA